MTQAQLTQKKHYAFLKLLTFSSTLGSLKERDALVSTLHFIQFS